jgi:hypothetical protein
VRTKREAAAESLLSFSVPFLLADKISVMAANLELLKLRWSKVSILLPGKPS